MESTSTTKTARETTDSTTIIHKYSIYAGCAGLVPIPLVDVAAVAAIQFDLLKQLSRYYRVDFVASTGKAWVAAIGGSLLARICASTVKAVPFMGLIAGSASMAIMSAASTYALGRLVDTHFANGGTPETLNLKSLKSDIRRYTREGREVVIQNATWEKETVEKESCRENAEAKLQGLEQMLADGVITREEYETTKARILAAV